MKSADRVCELCFREPAVHRFQGLVSAFIGDACLARAKSIGVDAVKNRGQLRREPQRKARRARQVRPLVEAIRLAVRSVGQSQDRRRERVSRKLSPYKQRLRDFKAAKRRAAIQAIDGSLYWVRKP